MSAATHQTRQAAVDHTRFGSLLIAGAALMMLLIGSWVPDPRLTLSGLPLSLLLMLAAASLVGVGRYERRLLRNLAILQLPLIALGISAIWSPDPAYGTTKLMSLLITGNLCFLLFFTVWLAIGTQRLIKLLLVFLSLLLLLAVIYKLRFGLFRRDVPFFLNGPIVFGRLMAIAMIMSIIATRGFRRIVLVTVFFLAVLWAQSKGPLIACVLTSVVAVAWKARWSFVARMSLVVFFCVAVAGGIAWIYINNEESLGRLAVLVALVSGDFSVLAERGNAGSFGIRIAMWLDTILLIREYPLGVGVGGWGSLVGSYGYQGYPHNLVLELISEGGIVVGSLALIPFFAFLARPVNAFWLLALTLLIAQQVSGDLADARFLLVFSMLAIFADTDQATSMRSKQHEHGGQAAGDGDRLGPEKRQAYE